MHFAEIPGHGNLKGLAGYSLWVLLIHIFGQVIYYTDNLVAGAHVSVAAITFYSLGGSLIEHMRTVVASLTSTFMPLASICEAGGETDKLRLLLINGTRIVLLVALPIQIAPFLRGKTSLNLWMRPQICSLTLSFRRYRLRKSTCSLDHPEKLSFGTSNQVFPIQKRRAKERLHRRYTGSLSGIFYDTFVAGRCSHSELHHCFACCRVLVHGAVHGQAMAYLDIFARRVHLSD